MIQFNLLPDVKKQYVKAKRTKRLIYTASLIVSAAAVGTTVLMFTFVHVAQKKNISDLTNDIKARASDIKQTPDLNKILTVQNQLSILPQLHESKPESSRIFDYVTFMSPQQVIVSSLDVDFETNTITVSGTADKIATVNKYVENIKAVRYVQDGSDDSTERTPYSDVQTELSGDNVGATYQVAFAFDPVIFDNTKQIIMRLGNQEAGEGTQ